MGDRALARHLLGKVVDQVGHFDYVWELCLLYSVTSAGKIFDVSLKSF